MNADFSSRRLLQMLSESTQRSSRLHHQFLHTRQAALHDMRALIALQMTGANNIQVPERPSLFNSQDLDAFGVGRVSDCLGPAFARYDGRRIPRIPNGDLKMMSRVVEIHGQPHQAGQAQAKQDASVVVEYDVPRDAWYLRDTAYPDLPCSLYMEAALQPCGFLSAYLDSYALVPTGEFFFRNLDGSARVIEAMDLRGQTITTQARMLYSTVGSGTVIQKFAFEMRCAGRVIYAGESTFGYFSAQSMLNQVGLDSGRPVPPAIQNEAGLSQSARRLNARQLQAAPAGRPYYHLAQNRLNFLDEIEFVPQGGRYGQGYLYARRPVNPQDWYYPFHFYQDPVMPGSLGVEAILEAMQAAALTLDLGRGLRSPRFGPVAGPTPMTWRYRGQITQQHKLMELEVHLRSVESHPGGLILPGDASLWVDGLRIYEVNHAAVGILEE